MGVIEVKGIEELQKKLKKNANLSDVKFIVRQNGKELQRKIQRNADFAKGYQTGTTKRNVSLEIKDDGFTAEAGPETDYAEYLEFGTRFMEAQPFVQPALDEQKDQFISDLKKIME